MRTSHETYLDKMMAFADQQDERYTSKVIIIVVPREGETCPVGGQVGYEATEGGADKMLKDVIHAMDHYCERYGIRVLDREARPGEVGMQVPLGLLMQYLMSRGNGPFEL